MYINMRSPSEPPLFFNFESSNKSSLTLLSKYLESTLIIVRDEEDLYSS
jgi:hypothetical protein